LEAVQRVEITALCIEGNHCQGRLLIPHLSVHLLKPPPR
jgi:hypothetical protein